MEYKKKYNKTETTGRRKNFRKSVVPSIQEPTEEQSTRRFVNPIKPLMSEEDASRDQWNHGSTEQRTFGGTLKPLMSEAEKEKAQVLELSYDFSCRIIRLYKYLNEGKLSKASIALKEARESENWLSLLRDNGYLSTVQAESLIRDCSRINQ